jgi:hypothetical protein
VPIEHINLEAIEHLAGAITDYPGIEPRGTLEDVDVMGEPVEQGAVMCSEPSTSVHSAET